MRRNHRGADSDERELPKTPLNKETLSQLLKIYRFMRPYQGYFILGMVCLFLSSSVLLAFPELTGRLIDDSLGKNDWVVQGIDNLAFSLVGVLVVQTVFSFLRVYFFAQVSERSMADIRKSLFQKYMQLPMAFYDARRSGELLSRITADVSLLQDTFSVTLAEFVRQLITLVVGISLLFVKSPKLTLFMLSIVPVLVIAAMFFGRFIRKLSKQTQDQLAESNIIVEETLQAISVVKAFTNELFEVGRYQYLQQKVVQTALKGATFRGLFVSFILFTIFGSIVAVLWYGTTLVADGTLKIGDLTSFIIYTMFIGGSIGGLGSLYGEIQKALGASERILEILNQDQEPQKEQAAPIQMQGDIAFKNVCFSYPTRPDVQVLNDLSLQIKAGEKVALVGHSGAGKSTIIQLLLRFYDLKTLGSGQIEVDGLDYDAYNLNDYRSKIGIVPQEVILFGGTIKENIAYGKPDATDEEIIEAAQKANAWQFIEQFPQKWDTLVGERGVKLSGGQRQRIAIARAILKNPALLILDEATSSLDAESEHLVQEALEKLMKERTTLIIAHRLATIQKADFIYVLEKGSILEKGKHEELLQKGGKYSDLVRLQRLEEAI
ncbi:ABC transporter ATP-binding protein [Hugenholtzia roseola]|uniref:ABC transporter ATP-binding protein n=1 Tax=Hugenholtzia roseola TaxID=1002 RepID=UPI000429D464|nr:ABC transporter transmembrane domain-containing protein [Hugenholtzia roseola]